MSRMSRELLAFILVLAGLAWAITLAANGQEPPPAPPINVPVINFPVIEPAPTPAPPPIMPGTTTPLPAGVLYVITSAKPFFVIDGSVDGLVAIEWDTGPVRIRDRFIEDPSKVQSKVFKDQYVAIVTASGVGRCKLIVFPAGVADQKDVIQRLLDVQGAQPTPGPGPGPLPGPSDDFGKAVQAAYTTDTAPTDKSIALIRLASVWRVAAKTMPKDQTLTTSAKVLEELAKQGRNLVGDPAVVLPKTRQTIAAELNRVMGTNPAAAFDQTARDLATKTFARIADVLDSVK